VDKGWQRQGLKDYSTAAILGTLGHYGVTVTEEDFRKLADKGYPVAIGSEWSKKWKGTGPFKPFPFVAAQELWRRWLSDRVAPHELSERLAELMGALLARLSGSQSAPVGPAFEKMRAVRERLPLDEKGAPQTLFIEEALSVFDQRIVEQFDGLAEALAERGHGEDAEAFADLEEFLLPDRRGISKAIVRAARGDKQAAAADLVALVGDASRAPISRLLAVDGLIHLKAHSEAASTGRALLDEAEKGGDLHLALDLVPRLEHVYKATNDRMAMLALTRDAARLEEAHDRVHPGHRRHGHRH
jgi:hypothetical protein